MEHTKAWVVSATARGLYFGGSPYKVFFSREEAEFYCWKRERENGGLTSLAGYYSTKYYSVREVQVDSIELTGKEYIKYVHEKLSEVNKSIAEKQTCSEKDTKAIAKLEEQRERYQSLTK